MTRTLSQYRTAGRTAFVLAAMIASMLASHVNAATSHTARASSRIAADVVTQMPVSYHLDAQFTQGLRAGNALGGQVSGTVDSMGALTATLTVASGITWTVMGTITGTVAAAPVNLKVSGGAGTITLTGRHTRYGQWVGAIHQGQNTQVGSWMLTPETQTVTFDLGGTSSKTSKDQLKLVGELSLQTTADGWGDGTFSFLNNNRVLVAEGRVSNGNLTATIFWPGKGAVMLVGTSKSAVGVNRWTGTFVGPAQGDTGAFIGEG